MLPLSGHRRCCSCMSLRGICWTYRRGSAIPGRRVRLREVVTLCWSAYALVAASSFHPCDNSSACNSSPVIAGLDTEAGQRVLHMALALLAFSGLSQSRKWLRVGVDVDLMHLMPGGADRFDHSS